MRYIDEEVIYRETDGGKSIFQYYFPNYDYGNVKAKLKLRDEKTPSAQIRFYKNTWRITDFGNQQQVNSQKAVPFVMWYENLSYYEALLFIEEVILRRQISQGEWKRPSFRADYESREMGPDDKKGEYNFVYKEPTEITDKDLQAIGRYVTRELLERYNCRAVKYYEYCGMSKAKNRDVVHRFIATEDYPIFVFDYGKFKKIYKPHDPEKKNRFLYAGEKPKDFIYGWRQLQGEASEFFDETDEIERPPKEKPKAKVKDLYRCSGESDAMNLASLGFHVYWLNSETAELPYDKFKELDDLCENHYQIMDLDYTGREMAMRNAVKYIDLFTIELPEWIAGKKDFRGNPCKDLKDFINLAGSDWDETRSQFVVRKAKARKVRFWFKTDRGYEINMEYFYFFLNVNGFYQMDYTHLKNTKYVYIRIKGKVVEIIHPEDIKRVVKQFTRGWIQSKNLTDEIPILNKLNTSAQISEANMDSITKRSIDFKNVTVDTEYLHFRNGSLRITGDAIERIKHEDIPNYILGALSVKNETITHLIPHNVNLAKDAPAIEVSATPAYAELLARLRVCKTEEERLILNSEIATLAEIDRYQVKINDEGFIFTNFIRDITRIYWRKELENGEQLTEAEKKEEMLALANLMFCIGYLCAQYKHQGKPWIVFLQDTRISQIGQSSGRSGKSLVSKAFKYARQQFYIEGRKLDDKNQFQFVYDGLTEFHDIIEVDDLAEFADFSFFYSQSTGNRVVNSKHTSPFTLDYKDSGKMVISSNFELPNTDSSTLARLLNCGVSDFYHEQTPHNDYKESRSPLSKFGRELYTDFTEEEWGKFYHFIAYCIQLQMRFNKIQPPMTNLEKRQLRRKMSEGLGREETFLSWANDYFVLWDPTDGVLPEETPDAMECVYFNTYFNRKTAFQHFMENSGISDNKKKSYTSQRFKIHLEAWVKYHGFTLNPEGLLNSQGRILKKINGRTEEFFYIQTSDVQLPGDRDNEPDAELGF